MSLPVFMGGYNNNYTIKTKVNSFAFKTIVIEQYKLYLHP